METNRFEKLLDLYFDEALDGKMTEEFERMLLDSVEAREAFKQHGKLHGMLSQIAQENWGRSVLPISVNVVPQTKTSFFNKQWVRAALAALAACFAGLMLYLFVAPNAQPEIGSESGSVSDIHDEENKSMARAGIFENPQWFAVIRREVNVEWENPLEAMIAGESMAARRIKFKSGMVEIQTDRGVLITLEGPADLEVISGMEVLCRKGRLRVDVPPPAIGFQVRTPQFDVVDRGTSFAMEVSGDKKSEVHVIEGLVEIVSGPQTDVAKRELREGQAVGVADGVFEDIISDGAAFPSTAKVNRLARKLQRRGSVAWERRRNLLAEDPSCLVYFDFQEEDAGAVLVNKAINGDPSSDGTIVGAQWVEGRWPGKRALEFRSAFDRVLFSLPGEHQSLTCLASIRLDALDSPNVALLSPSHGDFRWEIGPSTRGEGTGYLLFSHEFSGVWKTFGNKLATPLFRKERLGTWVQVAFVWDGENRVFDHYVNGKRLLRRPFPSGLRPSDLGLKLGQLEIGNRTELASEASAMEHFVGCVDEFVVLDRALTFQDIRVQQIGNRASWSNAGGDGQWGNPENWYGGLTPDSADTVFVDQCSKDAALFKEGFSAALKSVRVGTAPGLEGELRMSGGTLQAIETPVIPSRIGVGGGTGRFLHQSGHVRLNALQIGLNTNSIGTYRLEGGALEIQRSVGPNAGSIAIGHGGKGRLEIVGGALQTRTGIRLGQNGGVGSFLVAGSKPEQIAIGSFGSRGGFWVQETGNMLGVEVDDGGLTTVFVDDVEGNGGDKSDGKGNVTFAKDSILDVSFSGTARSGSWDVMHWEGELTNQGLRFSESVDQSVWSFQFVDTDESGAPDTLRVFAKIETP